MSCLVDAGGHRFRHRFRAAQAIVMTDVAAQALIALSVAVSGV
jgi:hypothetical protein